jgi:hypothetical protein
LYAWTFRELDVHATWRASYLVDRKGPSPELLEALRDETTREITREALRLPEREREIVLGIVRQFGETL